jgi:hypothetical protein
LLLLASLDTSALTCLPLSKEKLDQAPLFSAGVEYVLAERIPIYYKALNKVKSPKRETNINVFKLDERFAVA